MSYAVGSRYVSAYGTLDCHCLSSDAEPKLECVAIVGAGQVTQNNGVLHPRMMPTPTTPGSTQVN